MTDEDPPAGYLSREIIRIHPRRIINWGIDPDVPGMSARDATV
ncbi:hypothetical protein FDG2_3432 [Candidatus Protofrankia californiensis]|uniref:Uncharacterized protein n=1 Tax=Candidatus Protofrankia californiensis TaxID=1839754 RepID=A0A1C3NZP1_9ACTN|nr:hypothetical protein FDG2_3432 [Candidatus Protofrankia californiensis]